jgi:hypothetical protein
MSAALLPQDYRDRTIKVLEELRDGIRAKHAQALEIAKHRSATGDYHLFARAMGEAVAFGTIEDDIAMFIAKEQGR